MLAVIFPELLDIIPRSRECYDAAVWIDEAWAHFRSSPDLASVVLEKAIRGHGGWNSFVYNECFSVEIVSADACSRSYP